MTDPTIKAQAVRIRTALLDTSKSHYPDLAYEVLQALDTVPFAMPWKIEAVRQATPSLPRKWLRRDNRGAPVVVLSAPEDDEETWTYSMWTSTGEVATGATGGTAVRQVPVEHQTLPDVLAYVDAVLALAGWRCLAYGEAPDTEPRALRAGPWTGSQKDDDWLARYDHDFPGGPVVAQVRPTRGKAGRKGSTFTWSVLGHIGEESHQNRDIALENAKVRADNRLKACGYTLKD
jgi:hypothetical protein